MKYHLAVALLLVGGCQSVKAEDYSSEDYWRRQRRERNWADNAMHEGGRVKGSPRYKVYRPGEVHNYRAEEWREKPNFDPGERLYYYGAPVDRTRNETSYAGAQRIQRDVLSNVMCFPQIEELSVEANTEEGAWKDAQRAFENRARWMYGERAMDIKNAVDIRRQCSRSSGNQSVVGKVTETVAGAFGGEGYKHRCAIIARPCLAPIQYDAETKADK